MTPSSNHKKFVLDWLSKAVERLAIIQFTALMVIIFLQFCTRYLLNDSLAWTEEIARYLLLSLVFTGSLLLAQKGEHIFLEVTYRLSPRVNTKPLALFSTVISCFYYLTLAIFGSLLALKTEQSLISIPVPKALIYGFIVLTFGLCTLVCAVRLSNLFSKTSEEIYTDIENNTEQVG